MLALSRKIKDTLQGTNISHLGKRKIIIKMPFFGDMLIPWRVYLEYAGANFPQETHFQTQRLTQVRNRWLCFHPIRMLGPTWIFFLPFWGVTWEAFLEELTQKSLREKIRVGTQRKKHGEIGFLLDCDWHFRKAMLLSWSIMVIGLLYP